MRWVRRLSWAVVGLLLLWGAAWLAVPALVKWQLPIQLGERLGRSVTVGGASFEPWALRLTLTDLAVDAAPGAASPEPQFAIARFQIDVDARSLLRLAPVVESLQLSTPRLRLARTPAGRLDIDDVLQHLAPKAGEPAPGPAHFALYNLTLTDGEVVFDDQLVGREHRLSGLTLALPFLSNLPSQLEVKVEPSLAFTLDGARYDSAAEALPFAPDRPGTLKLHVAGVDVEPFLGYLPESLPVRVRGGRLDADLAIAFAAPDQGTPSVSISGKLGLQDLVVAERGGAPLLALAKSSLTLKDVRPLARKAAFGAWQVDGLQLHLDRDAQGRLGLQRLQPQAAPAAGTAAGQAPAQPWQASLEALEIVGARVFWNDAAVAPASAWLLDAIDARAERLQWPAAAPMPFTLQATLRPQADATKTLAVLSLQGLASDSAATAAISLSALSVAAVAPYANAAQRVSVAGTGAASGQFEWAARTDAQPMRLRLNLDELAIDGLAIGEPAAGRSVARGDTLAAQRLALGPVGVDLVTQSVEVAKVRLVQPRVRLERGRDGAWNLARLAGPTRLEDSARPLVRAAAEATWQVRVDEVALEGGRVALIDALPAPGHDEAPVRLGIDALDLGVSDLRLRGERLVSTPQVTLSARVVDRAPGREREQPGVVEWRGRIGLAPSMLTGKVRVQRLPIDALQAYAAHPLGVRLERAEAGFEGGVAARLIEQGGLQLDLDGDAVLSDLKVVALERPGAAKATPADRELLNWRSLAVNGLRVELRPRTLPKVALREAVLSDFFARLVLTEEGRLNLRDVAAAPAAAASAPAASAAAATHVTQAAPADGPRLPLELDMGGLRLVDGRIDFSDHFVRPNYSAALTDLEGEVGAFRTGLGETATLRLGGHVAGTGRLEIEGRVKPNAVPRQLDVRAKASDIELAPLSTYSAKYAGYAIERGKLSVEVHYTIDPAGRLEASHQLVLNQLTFGEHVDSPTATKLPVLLAVALLKDRNGVIDVNLPVSGSLEDPQFSLGPIIWQVIGNLIAKAATAPFALLAGGGGPDMSFVAFEPGTARLAPGAAGVIARVAQALVDRPALKMTVVGEADPGLEREAYQRAAIEQRLQQEARREQAGASGAAGAPPDAPVALTPEVRARLLKVVYRATDLPDKPRNVIGLKADIGPDEMEALLRASVEAGPEAMRELALQRGLAVRDALVAKGLSSDRLFVGNPRLVSGSGNAGGADAPPWTPRVELTLDTR